MTIYETFAASEKLKIVLPVCRQMEHKVDNGHFDFDKGVLNLIGGPHFYCGAIYIATLMGHTRFKCVLLWP